MFYTANKKILQRSISVETDRDFLISFWTLVAENMTQWKELERKEISKVDLRENYIATQAVIIYSIGRVGSYFYVHPEIDMKMSLAGLADIDWRRSSAIWKLRTIRANGRMITNDTAIILTANVIKSALKLPLDSDEQLREEKFNQNLHK